VARIGLTAQDDVRPVKALADICTLQPRCVLGNAHRNGAAFAGRKLPQHIWLTSLFASDVVSR